jgi:Cu2+-exporting ATPase
MTIACPACSVVPAAIVPGVTTLREGPERRIELSLPAVHCATCIATVENGLSRLPAVRWARVNLSRRLVSIRVDAVDGIEDNLIAALARLGYEAWPLDSGRLGNAADAQANRELLARLGVAGFAMMNVMLLSVGVWSGAADASRDLFHWVSALIALPAVAFSGQPFFRAAWASLRARRMNMDVPISLAMILACASSLVETALHGEHAYFDAAISLTFFLLAGRYLDFRTRAAARSAAAHLAALEVQRATRLDADGSVRVVDLADLSRGDTVVVATGMKVPVDGAVAWGTGELDASLLTGETRARDVAEGDPIHAGMINLGPPLRVTVQEQGDGMLVRRIARVVAEATAARGRAATLADRAARLYAPLVHIIAFAAFVWWMATTGDVRASVNVAIATLIITCPCALGLAVPAVLTVASGRLFRIGLLLKDGAALERLAGVTLALFDKTGTLTTGLPVLRDAATMPRRTLSMAAGLAMHSAHPLSRALVAACTARGFVPMPLADVAEVAGQGIAGRHAGHDVRLGRAGFAGVADPVPPVEQTSWLAESGRPPVALRFVDDLRPGAATAVAALRRAGLATALLSGDAEAPAADVARAAGLDRHVSGLTPEDKVDWVRKEQERGAQVLMVGDGLNDTASLVTADVSVALASGVDATRAVADLILIGGDLTMIARAVTLARRARRRIVENFGVAFVYNLLAVPLAVAGLATPLAAAVAMSTSSILVTANALRLPGRRRGPW